MELDSFLASPRWEILQIISNQPSSPIEIAERLGTTVSYISQQLKLLEAAQIVKKERTGAVEKGKPRTIFSISKEMAYITPLSKDISTKKTIYLTEYHKLILKIWQIENNALHEPINKLLNKINVNLSKISFVGVDPGSYPAKIYFVSGEKSLKIKDLIEAAPFSIEIYSENQISKIPFEKLNVIHNPDNLFRKDDMKGGNNL